MALGIFSKLNRVFLDVGSVDNEKLYCECQAEEEMYVKVNAPQPQATHRSMLLTVDLGQVVSVLT